MEVRRASNPGISSVFSQDQVASVAVFCLLPDLPQDPACFRLPCHCSCPVLLLFLPLAYLEMLIQSFQLLHSFAPQRKCRYIITEVTGLLLFQGFLLHPAGTELGNKVVDEGTSKDETSLQILWVLVPAEGFCSSSGISEWEKLTACPSLGSTVALLCEGLLLQEPLSVCLNVVGKNDGAFPSLRSPSVLGPPRALSLCSSQK